MCLFVLRQFDSDDTSANYRSSVKVISFFLATGKSLCVTLVTQSQVNSFTQSHSLERVIESKKMTILLNGPANIHSQVLKLMSSIFLYWIHDETLEKVSKLM